MVESLAFFSFFSILQIYKDSLFNNTKIENSKIQVQNKIQTLRKSYTFLNKVWTHRGHINNNNNNDNNKSPSLFPSENAIGTFKKVSSAYLSWEYSWDWLYAIMSIPETRKYWFDVQLGMVSSHGKRDPL